MCKKQPKVGSSEDYGRSHLPWIDTFAVSHAHLTMAKSSPVLILSNRSIIAPVDHMRCVVASSFGPEAAWPGHWHVSCIVRSALT